MLNAKIDRTENIDKSTIIVGEVNISSQQLMEHLGKNHQGYRRN